MPQQDIILPYTAIVEFVVPEHEISRRYKIVNVKDLYSWVREKIPQSISSEMDWLGKGAICSILDTAKNSTDWERGKISIDVMFSYHLCDSQEELLRFSNIQRVRIEEESVIRIPIEDMISEALLGDVLLGMGRNMFTQKELTTHLRQKLSLTDLNSYRHAWLDYGLPCRVSIPGLSNGWSKGRVYLEIGFQADDVEDTEEKSDSSLDEIRNLVDVK
jgi:KGK domain